VLAADYDAMADALLARLRPASLEEHLEVCADSLTGGQLRQRLDALRADVRALAGAAEEVTVAAANFINGGRRESLLDAIGVLAATLARPGVRAAREGT
jgi:hypothetical protein